MRAAARHTRALYRYVYRKGPTNIYGYIEHYNDIMYILYTSPCNAQFGGYII